MKWLAFSPLLASIAAAKNTIWDGRAPFSLKSSDLNASKGPYLTVVKGGENATHYSSLLGLTKPATPLWNSYFLLPTEQPISITIDNSSVFVPGNNPVNAQYGFRRTEFIAAKDGTHDTAFISKLESGKTVFHFSIKEDEGRRLNYSHEYQIVFIEPNDGTHVFGIQLGSPFTNPTGTLPATNAHSFKVLDHALNTLFSTPFTPHTWHNFAVQVDWTERTLAVLYSTDALPLKAVVKPTPNLSVASGLEGQGDFHFGVLKLPLVDPKDLPGAQGDVVHHGIQEGTAEGLLYSGVFVEDALGGVNLGYSLVGNPFP